MPRIMLLLAAACAALLAGCANNDSMTSDTSSSQTRSAGKDAWVYMIHPSSPRVLTNPTRAEQEMFAGHFAYLQDLTRKGVVIVAGPCLDDSGLGIIIFEAPDENAARQLMNSDPGVSGGVFIAELHPMRLSLLRERDR